MKNKLTSDWSVDLELWAQEKYGIDMESFFREEIEREIDEQEFKRLISEHCADPRKRKGK